MAATLETLQSALAAALGPQVKAQAVDRGQLTIDVAASDLVAACTKLRDDPQLRFTTLIDLLGLDYEGHARWEGPRFAVVYNLVDRAGVARGDAEEGARRGMTLAPVYGALGALFVVVVGNLGEVKLLVDGHSYKTAAAALDSSVNTVAWMSAGVTGCDFG